MLTRRLVLLTTICFFHLSAAPILEHVRPSTPKRSHRVIITGGPGVGKTSIIHHLKEQGYHVMMGAIDADNSGSIAFHEKFGFKVVGTIREVGFKFDHWLDLVFMQLILK